MFYTTLPTSFQGMHKKSTTLIRKPSEEKLARLWGTDHFKERSSANQADSQRGSEASAGKGLEDVAIDLSSSAHQESKNKL